MTREELIQLLIQAYKREVAKRIIEIMKNPGKKNDKPEKRKFRKGDCEE